MQRTLSLVVLALIAGPGVAGCGDDAEVPVDAAPDAYEVPWWTPEPGEASDWDIQLAPPYDTSAARALYMLDLFTVSPGGTLTYADASTVTVPAGALAGTVAALHARDPSPIVICRVPTGTIRLDDPDAMKLPGYAASPPDMPDPPAAGSVIGWSADGDPMTRYLDTRATSRPAWLPIILARYDHARAIGCDGVLPDGNDLIRIRTGFTIAIEDQQSLYEEVAAAAHQRELSVGQRANTSLPGQTDELVDDFDWVLPERCGEFDDCDSVRPYLNQRKAVFAVDFQRDDAIDVGIGLATACDAWDLLNILDGLHKDFALTSAYRATCP